METNPMATLPVDADGKAIQSAAGSSRATIKGDFGGSGNYSDSDEEQQEVIDGSKLAGGAAVVPLGNIDDAEVYAESTNKPKMKEKKNSKWGGKGESLTTETALQFMIKERALMDLETAKLKRENEELRRGLDSSYVTHSSSDTKDNKEQTDAQLKEELKRVKHENEVLKLRQMTKGGVEATPVPAAPITSLVQKGPLLKGAPPPDANTGANGLGLSSYSTGKKMRPELEKVKDEEILTISARLWDGGYLWKIPYNGKGDPDRRIVALKRAKVYPSPGTRAVIIIRDGVKSKPENYIVFPPTLVWYNSDRAGEIKNARELILYEGSCLMEGHNTNAFHKLLSRDKRIPPPELCFSMMTSTRSLDLAAEKIEDANEWKDALHMLLIELCPNKEWAMKELRRSKPFWNNSLEKPPAATVGASKSDSSAQRASKSQTSKATASAKSSKPLRREAIKKQVFNACRAGDCDMVESLFKAGVPANLADDKANSDTPLFVACQMGNAKLAELCLQYGAKNDPHPDFGETALHAACRHGHIEAAKVLLHAAAQSEADGMICNLTNEEAQTPLHLAAGSGHADIVELLLAHGAAIDCKDELEQTVLHVASGAGHRGVVAAILDHGGDHLLDYTDLGGSTPLHYAAQSGHLFVIKVLLETAADATARTMQGQTAYKLAMDRGHTQIATMLLEYMKDYKVSSSLSSGATVKRNAAKTNISRTGRLTIDVSGASPHVDEDELLTQGFGVAGAANDDDQDGAEVSLQINAHLPPSPKSSYGTPSKGIPPPPEELPRPHTQSSPGYVTRKSPFQTSPIVTTPQKGHIGYNGTEISPGAGGYRVLEKGQGLPPHTSPVQTGYMAPPSQHHGAPSYGGYAHPQQHSAREGYGTQPGPSASEMYSPLSARERTAPAMFDGMQVQSPGYIPQHQHHYTGSASPPPPAPHSHITSPVQPYQGQSQNQSQPQWNPSTQQWEYPVQQTDQYYHQQHEQYYSHDAPQTHGVADASWSAYPSGDVQGYSEQGTYDQGQYDGPGIAEQASVAQESYEDPLEEFECAGRFWTVYKTEEGHVYYLDASCEHSQWDDPRVVGVQYIDYEGNEEFESAQEGGSSGIAFLANTSPSPKASPPKSPSPKAVAGRRAFFDGPVGKEGIQGTPVVTRLFDDSDPFSTIVEPERRVTHSEPAEHKSSPPEARKGWTNGISPDTSEDEGDAPRIVVKGGQSRSRIREEPTSPSRMMMPRSKVPPPISTVPDEEQSMATEGSDRGRRDGRSRSRSRSRSTTREVADGAPTTLSLDSKLEAIAKRRASKSATSGGPDNALTNEVAEAKDEPPVRHDLKGAKGDFDDEKDAGDVKDEGDVKASDPAPVPTSKQEESRESLSARKTRYVTMLEQGESLRVVRREMESNDEPKELIKAVIAMADEVAPTLKTTAADSKTESKGETSETPNDTATATAAVAKEELSDLKQDPVVGKYAKMAAMGIPGPAVEMKMRSEGLEEKQMNRILAALDMITLPPANVPSPPKEELSDLKQDPVVGKYAKMAAMGVPHASVQVKMERDNVESSQANRILRALGIEPSDLSAKAPGPGSALAALAAGPGGKVMPRRPSVPMQTMHWDAIPKEKLEKSIWASAVDTDEEIKEDDMAEIEKLFGKEEKKGPRGAWGDNAGGNTATADTKPKKDRLYLIDAKRAQNVTIGLSQFKSVCSYKELIRAVCSLDSLENRLTADHLENLRNILPNATEIKNGSRMKESLHPAEEFLCTAAQYCPDLPLRLDCFITCHHFGTNCEEGLRNARKVIDACNEVISSDKLARVLQKMLAVGNIMNQGTFRGNATGFTVDSLLRMINMKGADKRTSVLDYVVKSLYDRGEEKVLVVADDLVVVEECCRMSGKEVTKCLSDLLSTFDTLKEECDRVKERRAAGSSNSPIPRESGSQSPAKQQIASTSELFVMKLDARIEQFRSQTEDVAKIRALMSRKVTELVEYFGEDEKECDTTSIFSVLQQFRKALKESKATAERKMRSAAASAAGAATNKRRSSMA